jgi:hypothetical protein
MGEGPKPLFFVSLAYEFVRGQREKPALLG